MSNNLEIIIDNLDDTNDEAFINGQISQVLYRQILKVVKEARANLYAERAAKSCQSYQDTGN
jgi:hypothetical protein